jgi:hypothetical protein
VVFQRSGATSQQTQQQAKVERLEQKMRQNDEVIAELMAEHVALILPYRSFNFLPCSSISFRYGWPGVLGGPDKYPGHSRQYEKKNDCLPEERQRNGETGAIFPSPGRPGRKAVATPKFYFFDVGVGGRRGTRAHGARVLSDSCRHAHRLLSGATAKANHNAFRYPLLTKPRAITWPSCLKVPK